MGRRPTQRPGDVSRRQSRFRSASTRVFVLNVDDLVSVATKKASSVSMRGGSRHRFVGVIVIDDGWRWLCRFYYFSCFFFFSFWSCSAEYNGVLGRLALRSLDDPLVRCEPIVAAPVHCRLLKNLGIRLIEGNQFSIAEFIIFCINALLILRVVRCILINI